MFAVLTIIRKARIGVLSLISIIVLAGCQTGTTTGGVSVNTSAPIPVALLVPLGAASEQEQKLARDLENAARLAISDLSGVEIDLRVYDTAGQAAKAREAAQKAASEGAKIILGPLKAEAANAAAVAVSGRGINVLSFSNNPTVAGGNLFLLGHTFHNTANRLTSFAVREGKSRILIVYADSLAGQLGKNAIEQAISRNGATLAGSVSYEFTQDGVIAAVPKIKAEAKRSGADTIFLTSNTSGALPLLSQMLPEIGLDKASIQYIGLTRWDTPPQTLELPGVQEGWFALPDPQRTAQFHDRFSTAYGGGPHALAGLAYDGIAAIGALAKSGQTDALSRASLTQSAGFRGVSGVFRFLPDGTNERGLAVATIRDRKVVVLAPAPQSFGGSGF